MQGKRTGGAAGREKARKRAGQRERDNERAGDRARAREQASERIYVQGACCKQARDTYLPLPCSHPNDFFDVLSLALALNLHAPFPRQRRRPPLPQQPLFPCHHTLPCSLPRLLPVDELSLPFLPCFVYALPGLQRPLAHPRCLVCKPFALLWCYSTRCRYPAQVASPNYCPSPPAPCRRTHLGWLEIHVA